MTLLKGVKLQLLPDADALMDAAEGLKYEEPSILYEVLEARHQEEIIHKHLQVQGERNREVL